MARVRYLVFSYLIATVHHVSLLVSQPSLNRVTQQSCWFLGHQSGHNTCCTDLSRGKGFLQWFSCFPANTYFLFCWLFLRTLGRIDGIPAKKKIIPLTLCVVRRRRQSIFASINAASLDKGNHKLKIRSARMLAGQTAVCNKVTIEIGQG